MMTRSRWWFLVLIACVTAACAREPKEGSAGSKPSMVMQRILAHHQKGDHDLDTKDLPLDAGMKAPAQADLAAYELYKVPYPPNYADYFSYRVLLHTATGRYWINVSGGIAGRDRYFGPAKVTDLPK